METSELREKYRHLMAVHLSQLSTIDENEYAGMLLDGQWVRVVLIRNDKEIKYNRLEIELTTCWSSPLAMGVELATSMIQTFISHLRYLQRLVDSGFELTVIDDGCVWSMSREFYGDLDDETIDLLLPPQ